MAKNKKTTTVSAPAIAAALPLVSDKPEQAPAKERVLSVRQIAMRRLAELGDAMRDAANEARAIMADPQKVNLPARAGQILAKLGVSSDDIFSKGNTLGLDVGAKLNDRVKALGDARAFATWEAFTATRISKGGKVIQTRSDKGIHSCPIIRAQEKFIETLQAELASLRD